MALTQTPPALFRQGLSARLRLLIAVIAAVSLIQADRSLSLLKPLRQGLSMVLYPVEQALLMPRDGLAWLVGYGQVIFSLQARQAALTEQETQQADLLLQATQLRSENADLRGLLGLRQSMRAKTLAAEISHYTKDAFSNRVILNRGSQHGVAAGHPVINAQGIVGQVVRVSPITAEVALLTDPSLTIPVSLPRSGVRSLASGSGDGQQVRLRYLNINAEADVGDMIVTSGLDGLYPAGLAVATISRIIPSKDGVFPQVFARPVAEIGTGRNVLVLLVDPAVIPPAPRAMNELKGNGQRQTK